MKNAAILLSIILTQLVCFGQDDKVITPNISKGDLFISTTFSVDHRQGENETNILQNLDKAYRLEWDITLRSGYFIKDHFAVGGFFKYGSDLDELEYEDDNGLVIDNRLERNYSIAPFIRNYLPLGEGQFCLFNETNLQFTYGSAVRSVENSVDLNRTTTESYELRLGIQPGISAFITDVVAVEVGTSLLGLSSTYSETVQNGNEDDKSISSSNNVDFKIDLLSLFLGITFYIPSK